MSKGSTKVAAPDPYAMAQADAIYNRIDQYTPFGNLVYSGPERNVAQMTFSGPMQQLVNKRITSDNMLQDMALQRQYGMAQGGLPEQTTSLQPGALQQYFGLPTNLQNGTEGPSPYGKINPSTGMPYRYVQGTGAPPQQGGGKGGATSSTGMPNGGVWGGARQAGQQQRAKGGGQSGGPMGVYNHPGFQQAQAQQPYRPGADMSVKPGQGVGDTGMSLPPGMTLPGGGINPNYDLGGGRTIGGGGPLGPQLINQEQPLGGGFTGQAPPSGQSAKFGSDPNSRLGQARARMANEQPAGRYGQQTSYMNGPGANAGPVSANQMIADMKNSGQTSGKGGGPGPASQQSQSPFGGTVGGMIDPSSFTQVGNIDQLKNFDVDRGRVEQAFFDRQRALLQPELDQNRQREINGLRARGFERGTEAFDNALNSINKREDLQMGNIANQAVLAGGGEQSRLFDIASSLGDRAAGGQTQLFNMADQLAQRDIQTQLQQANLADRARATQFNELASLLGIQQVAQPGLNNFFSPGNVDVMGGFGLQQQALQGNANRSADMKGGAMSGVAGLGSAAIGK